MNLIQIEKESSGGHLTTCHWGFSVSYFICIRGHTACLGVAHMGWGNSCWSPQAAWVSSGLLLPWGLASSPCRGRLAWALLPLTHPAPGQCLGQLMPVPGAAGDTAWNLPLQPKSRRPQGAWEESTVPPGKPRKIPCPGKNTRERLQHTYVSWNQPKLACASDLWNYLRVRSRFKGRDFQKWNDEARFSYKQHPFLDFHTWLCKLYFKNNQYWNLLEPEEAWIHP